MTELERLYRVVALADHEVYVAGERVAAAYAEEKAVRLRRDAVWEELHAYCNGINQAARDAVALEFAEVR